MPRKILPRIDAVKADKKPFTLHVTWDSGVESRIDVSDMIKTFKLYAPLRKGIAFKKVGVGEDGVDIFWNKKIDMAATTLWRLAQEQAGITMSPDAFKHWRERNDYTLDKAAHALGLSRRMVAYYEQGEKPVPRVVALAARALEMQAGL
jgi:DNA-binding transcriptional regulator YiaG